MSMRNASLPALNRAFARVPNAVLFAIELLMLGIVLAFAWKARSVWPAVPLADPDTQGYLNPALDWLGGLGFRQASGRDWFYPALVTLFLKTTGSFAGIVAWQRFFGLVTGVLMAVTWRCWVSLLPFPRGAHFVISLLGAVPIVVQLVNPQNIFYEMSIRPEAVLPLFVYGQLAAVVGYSKYRWQTPRALPSLILGALALVLAYGCYVLKPSWYLATAATSLPVLAGMLGQALPLKTQLLTPVLGVVISLLTLWLPGRVLMIRDTASVTLLPLALFCVHAQFIDDYFNAQLATLPDSDPGKAKLQHLDDVLKSEIRNSMNDHPYAYLKINPDYLLGSRPLTKALYEYAANDPEKVKAFCFSAYKDAILYEPMAYVKKVSTQFTYFLFPSPRIFFKDRIQFAQEYQRSADSMIGHPLAGLPPVLAEVERQYLADTSRLIKETQAGEHPPKRKTLANVLTRKIPSVAVLAPLFLLALLAAHVWPRLHALRLAGWSALFLFLAPFGNALGVCIVHALDIDRYCFTFGGYLLFALAAMAAFNGMVLGRALTILLSKWIAPQRHISESPS